MRRKSVWMAGLLAALTLTLAAGCGGQADTDEDYAERMAAEHKEDTPEASRHLQVSPPAPQGAPQG